MSKLELLVTIAMALIVGGVGYYVVLATEKGIPEYPEATCCAPIHINWIGFLAAFMISVIMSIILKVTSSNGGINPGDKQP